MKVHPSCVNMTTTNFILLIFIVYINLILSNCKASTASTASTNHDIPNFVSKTRIAQARCRLQNCQKLASQEEKRQQCWTWCGKLQPQKKPSEAAEATEAATKQQVEEEVAINVSFSVRGCGLIWNIESSLQQPPTSAASAASVIYQVYSQDSREAWHDEGQSVQNWINFSPPTLARTKAIRLTIIEASEDDGLDGLGKILVRNAYIPLSNEKTQNCQDRAPRSQVEQGGLKKPPKVHTTEEVRTSSYPGLVAAVTILAVICLILISFVFIKSKKNTLSMIKNTKNIFLSYLKKPDLMDERRLNNEYSEYGSGLIWNIESNPQPPTSAASAASVRGEKGEVIAEINAIGGLPKTAFVSTSVIVSSTLKKDSDVSFIEEESGSCHISTPDFETFDIREFDTIDRNINNRTFVI